MDIGPGESFFIRRGAVHGFNNLGQTDVKVLAVVTPALLGPDFFREAAEVVNVGGPPDVERLKAVLARHGLVAVMPGKLSARLPRNTLMTRKELEVEPGNVIKTKIMRARQGVSVSLLSQAEKPVFTRSGGDNDALSSDDE